MRQLAEKNISIDQESAITVKNITNAVQVLSGKWKFSVIFALMEGPLRFNEIVKTVQGITPKVLAKELKDLQKDGIIERKVYPTTPVAITYGPTNYCCTLKAILNELGHWGKHHIKEIS